jgi:prepilin-type N-terminal cleavage/methylation domain-containing protein
MPSCCAERRRTGGFTLIEMLFALMVIGLAMAAAATMFRTGLIGNETAASIDEALRIGQAKLDESGADLPLRPGISSGKFGRFAWQLAIARASDDEAAAAHLALYRIEARVLWRDGARERHVTLDTLRLGSAPPP